MLVVSRLILLGLIMPSAMVVVWRIMLVPENDVNYVYPLNTTLGRIRLYRAYKILVRYFLYSFSLLIPGQKYSMV